MLLLAPRILRMRMHAWGSVDVGHACDDTTSHHAIFVSVCVCTTFVCVSVCAWVICACICVWVLVLFVCIFFFGACVYLFVFARWCLFVYVCVPITQPSIHIHMLWRSVMWYHRTPPNMCGPSCVYVHKSLCGNSVLLTPRILWIHSKDPSV